MSKKSRDKGARGEREAVRIMQEHGLAAEKVSAMYRPGEDISCPVLGEDWGIEVKWRANGFKQLYAWLGDRRAVLLRADNQEFLFVTRLADGCRIISKAEGNK
jgi:Holliday junction resolvase